MIDPLATGRALLPGSGFVQAQALSGGLLNHVWRLSGPDRTAILKHAPPFVATSPAIPLSSERIGFEARALRLLADRPELTGAIRGPGLLAFSEADAAMLIEDLGDCPDLSAVPEHAGAVGSFIGGLHAATRGDPTLAEAFGNHDIQRTRLAVVYRQVGVMLAGHPQAAALGAVAEELGLRLCGPGRCLVMGDLWPPSVLITEHGVRIIDWEMAHFGQPAQDVAHLAAHLWMADQHAALSDFLTAYQERAGVLSAADRRDCAIHFGAEILARAAGPFAESGPYRGLDRSDPSVVHALAVASAALSGTSEWFAASGSG
jgi:hypothetical protein